MGYEVLGDVTTVTLGGINKESGKPNPTEVEGYLLRVEGRQGKFGPQKFYVLQTPQGEVGIYGKTDINKKMESATIGAMTKIAATDKVFDTGKGNPMKLFYVAQDKADLADSNNLSFNEPEADTQEDEHEPAQAPPALQTHATHAGRTPSGPASSPSTARQSQVQALINKSRTRTA